MADVQRQRVGWSDEKWAAVDAALAAELTRVRIVDEVIPTTRVGANDKTVTVDRIDSATRTIDDNNTIQLPELSVQFVLDKQQVEQPELTRALALVRRAASDFARLEDAMLLRGLAAAAGGGFQPDQPGVPLPPLVDIQRGQDRAAFDGLGGAARNVAQNPITLQPHSVGGRRGLNYGPNLLAAVASGIVLLEETGHMGPYHLILGRDAFVAALTPNAPALVLPKDRIEPLLASPIRRSPALDPDDGVLLSVGGDPADRVVAVEPNVRFIETTQDDRYRFRVYGVLVLRRKEPEAAVRLQFA